MYKRILLIAVIAFSILLGSAALPAYPQTGSYNLALAQDDPGSSLDDPGFMFDLSVITHEDIAGGERQNWIRKGINYIFERVIGVLTASVGGISILVMSYGGFLIMTGNMDKGKLYVRYSIYGLAFALLSYILVMAVQILIKSIYG
jgi:hypothetical protein